MFHDLLEELISLVCSGRLWVSRPFPAYLWVRAFVGRARMLWQLLCVSLLDRFGRNGKFHNEDLLQFGVFHCVLFPHHWAGRREPFAARLVKRCTLCWVYWSCVLCLAGIKGARAWLFMVGLRRVVARLLHISWALW